MKTVTVNSYNKDDLYQSTVLLFDAIRVMAVNKVGKWEVSESFTDSANKQFKTKYTNGKMWMKAVSSGEYHTYSYGAEK
jgi:hypothetical protein